MALASISLSRARMSAFALATAAVVLVTGQAANGGGSPSPVSPATCARQDRHEVNVAFTTPRDGSRIDLGRTPVFDLAGRLGGRDADRVIAVDLFADGVAVGTAPVVAGAADRGRDTERDRSHDHDRSWRYSTSATGGTHVLVACARTAAGPVARTAIRVRVVAPGADAVVVAPGVVTVPGNALATITALTPTTVTFAGTPPAAVGNVIVAGVSPTTPEGLMRRVTAISRKGSAAVLTTVPAALDEVFWQVDIAVAGAALTATSPPAAAAPPSTAAPTTRALAASGLAVDAGVSSTLALTREITALDGPFSFKGSATVALKASLDVAISIRINWRWGVLPVPTVTRARFLLTGVESQEVKGTFTGAGTLKSTIPLTPDIKLAPITILATPPVVLEPSVGLDVNLSASMTATATFGASQTNTISVGADYQNGAITNLGDVTTDAQLTTPWSGDGLKATGKASVALAPHLATSIDLVPGPRFNEAMGLEGSVTYPCPGSTTVDAFGQASVDGKVAILSKKLVEYKVNLPKQTVDLFTGPAPFCSTAPVVATEVLPDAAVGTPYSVALQAAGGTSPYTWAATGAVPPGLAVRADGTVTGTPSTPGSYTIDVSVTDGRGATGSRSLPIVIAPAALAVATTSLPDATQGVPYHGSLTASGGEGPLRWSLTSGELPAGIALAADGTISGTPTAAGAQVVSATVSDTRGATATRSLSLRVEALPPPVDLGPGDVLTPVAAPVCGPVCGTTWGDPHLHTFDGATYDLQLAGELVATRSTTDDYQVQVRQQPWHGSRTVSVNTAVAMMVNGRRVGVYLTDTGVRTLVDGVAMTPTADPAPLAGGGSLIWQPAANRETVVWSDGSFVAIDAAPGSHLSLSLSAAAARHSQLQGLLGNADGDRTNDVTGADGIAHPYPATVAEQLAAGATWRVGASASLFDYQAGETTETFTDRSFPYGTLTATDLPAANRDAAAGVCRTAGVTDDAFLAACTLDVAVSGNATVATTAATAQAVTGPPVEGDTALVASSPGLAWTDPAGGSGTAVATYGHQGCEGLTTDGACTAGVWPRLSGAQWIWTSQQSSGSQPTATFTATVTLTDAEAAIDHTLTLDADDHVRASVNGGPAIADDEWSTPVTVPVSLRPGANQLTFTVSNDGGPAGLAFSVNRATVRNGGFETPAVAGSTSLNAPATIGAWTVTSGSVDVVHDTWPAHGGTQSLDLNGCSPSRLTQALSLTPGRPYTLSLAYAGNPDGDMGPKPFHVEINERNVGGFSFDSIGASRTAMNWQTGRLTFTSADPAVQLAFVSDTAGCYGPVVDDVTVR
jgi:choice-of-anchor C domain-containing protein